MIKKSIKPGGILLLLSSPFAMGQSERPNIIYILTDQQTATAMSCAGNSDLRTPAMDRLADEGIRFDNAYCSFPLSSPSRACMMTGATPTQLEYKQNSLPLKAPFAEQSLGILLSNAGYDCEYAGKWHIPEASIPDLKDGFRNIHNHNDYRLADDCVKFLDNRKDKSKPFFLVAAFDNPHNICEYARHQNLPFATITEPPTENCPNLPANFAVNPFDAVVLNYEKSQNFNVYPTSVFSSEDWRHYRNAYFRLIELIDSQIGKILDELKKQNLLNNTLVIFSSDHGDGNASHHWNQKTALYEEVVNIPFMVRLPGAANKGTVNHHLLNNGTDLFATICDYAGVKTPEYSHGKSLRSILEGKHETLNDFVVSETLFSPNGTLFSPNGTFGYMVRTVNFKYICYNKGLYREQLYDMRTDRDEMINRAVEKKYDKILNDHRKILSDWLKNNGDSNAISIIPNE